ncbi:MAG: hypothetical protein EXS37_03690 [Opitutus sp.]|nr:hypothetical protein [Opitutus sp.]
MPTPPVLQVSCVQRHWAKPLEFNLERTLHYIAAARPTSARSKSAGRRRASAAARPKKRGRPRSFSPPKKRRGERAGGGRGTGRVSPTNRAAVPGLDGPKVGRALRARLPR